MKPLICLCMIVKNEATNIRRTLESVKPFIDSWVIFDTGSTDDTVQIIKETLANAPGRLVTDHPFLGYATSRNAVLTFAEATQSPYYTIMLSGDEVLSGGERLRAFLHEKVEKNEAGDAYCVTMQDEAVIWPYPRVLRNGGGWRYVAEGEGIDEIHEQPVGPNGEIECPVIGGVGVRHSESNIMRKLDRLHDDIRKLRKVVENEEKPLSDRARSILHLGKTYAVLAENERNEEGKFTPGGRWLTYYMDAMSMFYRCGQIYEDPDSPAHDEAQAMYCYFLYYHTADKCGLYEHHELIPRLAIIAEASPKLPEVHYDLARHMAFSERTTQAISPEHTARKALALAVKAASVAHAAIESPTTTTLDARMEWVSFKLAALCAKELKDTAMVKKLVAAGVKAGGPIDQFQGL